MATWKVFERELERQETRLLYIELSIVFGMGFLIGIFVGIKWM